MKMTVRKAVFPVGGMGSRFLPATKANPKEMLPIVDKPLIQYAVEEVVAAGIKELVFVTSSRKRAIEDHFDSDIELEAKLIEQQKYDLLAIVRNIIPEGVSCAYVRQKEMLGLGHAVLCAQAVVGNEPFAVLLADDLIDSGAGKSCMQNMLEQFAHTQASIVAVEKIAPQDTKKYGVVSPAAATTTHLVELNGIVEKPAPNVAPSNFGVVGRYILTPQIFSLLANTGADSRGEIQLTDAIAKLMQHEAVYAWLFDGVRYDCGSKLGYLEATLIYALKHPELGAICRRKLQAYLRHDQKQKV